jgi:hypothetical protein
MIAIQFVAPCVDRGEIEEMPRLLRDVVRHTCRIMLDIFPGIPVVVGLVDNKRHGHDNDGGIGGVLLLEEGAERYTVIGVVKEGGEDRM